MDGLHALYFSFVTLPAIGYGDVTPVTSVARLLSIMEATAGMLYMSVLIVRLASLYSSATPLPDRSDSGRPEDR